MTSLRLRSLPRRPVPLIETVDSKPQVVGEKNDEKNKAADNDDACSICNLHRVRYTCPTCAIPYCSVDCYRSHSDDCTESFYRNRVEGVWKLEQKDAAPKKELLASLDNHRSAEEFSPETLGHLWQLLEENNSDNNDEKSNLEALAEFLEQHPGLEEAVQTDVQDGLVQEYLLDRWHPWWYPELADGTVGDDDDDETDNDELDDTKGAPVTPPPTLDERFLAIPQWTSLRPVSAKAVDLGPNLIDLVGSVVRTLRIFHGFENALVEATAAAECFQHASWVLAKDARYTTVAEALATTTLAHHHHHPDGNLQSLTKPRNTIGGNVETDETAQWLDDIRAVLQGRHRLVGRALLEARDLLTAASAAAVGNQRRSTKRLTKKVEFYLSWVLHHKTKDTSCWSQLVQEVDDYGTNRLMPVVAADDKGSNTAASFVEQPSPSERLFVVGAQIDH